MVPKLNYFTLESKQLLIYCRSIIYNQGSSHVIIEMYKQIFFILLLFVSAFALYGDDSAVVRLTAKNFKELVINSD